MNLEQRNRIMQKIHRLEGLLAWAKAHGEKGEVERITRELSRFIEEIR